MLAIFTLFCACLFNKKYPNICEYYLFEKLVTNLYSGNDINNVNQSQDMSVEDCSPECNEPQTSVEGGSMAWLVSVDRKISAFDWFLVLTGPILNPFIGIFVLIFAIRMRRAKNSGDSKKALRSKAIMMGLSQWCYRISMTFFIFFAVIFTMFKIGRFQ